MDSDIYRPSVHIMMGVEEQKIVPVEKYDIKMMSPVFLVADAAPRIK